jgi:hypothetical protein
VAAEAFGKWNLNKTLHWNKFGYYIQYAQKSQDA